MSSGPAALNPPRSLPSIAHSDWLVIQPSSTTGRDTLGGGKGLGGESMIRGQQSFSELIVTVTQDAALPPTTGEAWLVFLWLKQSF